MRYRFVQEFLYNRKFLFLTFVGFIGVACFEYILIPGLINSLFRSNIEPGGVISYDFTPNYLFSINPIITLVVTFLVFKFLRFKDYRMISLTIGILSALIFTIIVYGFNKPFDFLILAENTFAVATMVFVWIVISESKSDLLRNLSLGYFSYLIVEGIIRFIFNSFNLGFDIASLISVFFYAILFTFIFELPIRILKPIIKYSK